MSTIRRLFIFILFSGLFKTVSAQSVLIIHQTGLKDYAFPELFIGEYADSCLTKINDSTLVFKTKMAEPDYLLIGVDLAARPKWFTRMWIDPRMAEGELTIDYAKKTAATKAPSRWDSITRITSELEQQGKFKEELSLIMPFISTHPKSFLSLWYLSHSHALYLKGIKTRQALFNKLNPSLSKYPLYNKTKKSFAPRHYPKAGEPFKEFKLSDKNGKMYNSAGIQNKYILLHFWSNKCSPCTREMDSLAACYRSLDTSRIILISIATDDDMETWKRSKAAAKISWLSLWQPDSALGELCLQYNLQSVPFMVLFDKHKKFVRTADDANETEGLRRLLKEVK